MERSPPVYSLLSTPAAVNASACGIALLGPGQLAPMTSTSLGLGDAVCAVLDDDPDEIVLGLGGSASTDGGTGLLVALGARLLDADDVPVPPGETANTRK